MTQSFRRRILAAAEARMNGSRPADVPEVRLGTRGEEPPVPGGQLTFIEDQAEAIGGGVGVVSKRVMTMRVEWRVGGSDLLDVFDAVDPMTSWATSVLGGQRLGGLAAWVRESTTRIDEETRDLGYILVQQEFEVTYIHGVNDATR
jgi:hypothetical protein